MIEEADRLIAAALRDHARLPAAPQLRRKLERRHLGVRGHWLVAAVSAAAGAIAAAAFVLIVVRSAPTPTIDAATEAVGDHLRMLVGRGLGVEVSDMHQVKPWFAGKIDFVPPVTFLGDEDYPLAGGDVAVFLGHKAAEFVYHRHLHVISLFVFQADDIVSGERTIQGFHVITWGTNSFGLALVSDLNFDELRVLRSRLR